MLLKLLLHVVIYKIYHEYTYVAIINFMNNDINPLIHYIHNVKKELVRMKNGRLKGLIFAIGKNQRQVSLEAKIPETRLSHFINGRQDLTTKERKSLARVLKIGEAELDEQTAPVSVK